MKSKPEADARTRALALLARREHTRVELARKLEAAGFGRDELQPLLDERRAEELFDRRRPLPRPAVRGANHLHRVRESPWLDPGEALRHSRRLRRNDLQLRAAVPAGKHFHDAAAHAAVPVVHDGVGLRSRSARHASSRQPRAELLAAAA